MHEKSTNCIPMQAEEREIQRCFTEKKNLFGNLYVEHPYQGGSSAFKTFQLTF